MDEILKDKRFAHIVQDPRYKRIPKRERKVKIDKRFHSMFKDKKFKVRYTIDKRGRPANTTSSEDLRRYYDISTSEEDSLSDSDEATPRSQSGSEKRVKLRKKRSKDSGNGKKVASLSDEGYRENSDSDDRRNDESDESGVLDDDEYSEDEALTEKVKDKLRDMTVDYARGEGVLLSDSSSDDDTVVEDAAVDSEEVDHGWGELDRDAETTRDATSRLAVCHMDWDRVRAQDLLVLLSSFLPKTGGAIQKVTIYPSEFGLERMKEEEVNGPPELREGAKNGGGDSDEEADNEEENDENEEGRQYHMEKLRRYQLNRLRYYYAIVECDSVGTAEVIYKECDGLEYESSATRLDLRFVPDDMSFEQEPRDWCDTLPEPGKYAPRLFTTTALQQATVELTWDETDPRRVELARKLQAEADVDDTALRAYLASSSSEDDDGRDEERTMEDDEGSQTGDPISRYRTLLEEAERKEQEKKKKSAGVQMEVTFGLGLKEKTEKMVKERLKSGGDAATPFEQMMAKRREKIKRRRDERKKLQRQDEAEETAPFSDDDIPSDVDMNDPYFKEELQDVAPGKGKNNKRKHRASESEQDEDEKRRKAELELLLLDGDDEGKRHFSLKAIQEAEQEMGKKKKKKKLRKKGKKDDSAATGMTDDFQVNVDDERFAALFTSHHYNIDPADPHYRSTRGTEALRAAKLARRQETREVSGGGLAEPGKWRDPALSQLVKSVKMKTRGLAK